MSPVCCRHQSVQEQQAFAELRKARRRIISSLMGANGQKLFKSVSLHTLYDEDATREKILAKLDELAQVINQEDVFIFYYAGHGSMVDNQFYFIPTESSRLYDQKALQKEAIEASLLQERFKHIRALKQLIVMDACQSGGSVELLATRARLRGSPRRRFSTFRTRRMIDP
ncbi:MAG: CHAT domain-containing protein [Bacteroidia bacterium]|nr:CHAT domain-containing protein [Bacteroidia bacterium]